MTYLTLNSLRISLACCLLFGAADAFASDWQWHVTPYVWATDIAVDASIDDRQVVDAEIPVEDLIEDIDTIAQVRIEARHGRHGVMLDLFDVTMSKEPGRATLPNGAGEALLSSEVGMTILDLAGVYDPKGDGQGLSFLFGARILDQRAEIDARFDLGSGTSVAKRYETGETLIDALVGVRFDRSLTPRWTYRMQADVSTGGTDLTWSAGPSVGWRFGKRERYELLAGYRYMEVDFASDDAVEATMTLSGFSTGLRVSF